MIEITDLTVVFGRTVALDSVSASLEDGVVGVFGPNGAGKSTLLRVLAGLQPPTRGRVRLGDRATSARDETFRRRVGYVGHLSSLYDRLSLRENLALFAALYGVEGEAAERVLDAVGLEGRADTRAGELSAGLRRRAAVARALLHDPTLLLLDEPYANLDDDAAERVSSAVRAWRAPGRLALVATHGAKKLKGWADAGLILRRGRVVTLGRYRGRATPAGASVFRRE
jgi:heme exporter protein A